MKKNLIFFFLLFPSLLFSLENEFEFMGLKLAMNQSELQDVILMNTNLQLDTTRYLGLLNEEYPFTLKATYHPYIDQIYLDFYEGLCYQITVKFSSDYFDYYMLANSLSTNYGEPVLWTTSSIKWQDSLTTTNFNLMDDGSYETNISTTTFNSGDSDIRMTLEFPTTLKAFDNAVLLRMVTELSQVIQTREEEQVDRAAVSDILGEFGGAQ